MQPKKAVQSRILTFLVKSLYFSHCMKSLSRTLAKLLLLVALLSPVAQVHTDHDSSGSSSQSLLSVVLAEKNDGHDEAAPHEDATHTEAEKEECTDHPAEIQAVTSCHTSSRSSVQVVAAFVGKFMYPQTTAYHDLSSYSDARQRVSTHKPTLLFLRV